MATAAQYTKYSHREHVLELPDTYIGSVDTSVEPRWVYDAAKNQMERQTVRFCPGFLKIFDELLVNARDQMVRQRGRLAAGLADGHPVKHIDVVLSDTTISVKNDGDGIPVDKHGETGVYAPELIFGHLLTSSNYDKAEEKTVGGKNGYGAKLTNIFSTSFVVETVDHRNKKKYRQEWTKNMTVVSKPSITASTLKPYTHVSYTPDLSRFLWSSDRTTAVVAIPADMLAVLATRVVDLAACAGKDCRVTLNGSVLASNTFPKYIELYLSDSDEASVASTAASEEAVGAKAVSKPKKLIAYEQAGERWEIAAILTKDLHGDVVPDERHVSFVNGIATRRGGKHVDSIAKTVLTEFCALAKKKAKIDLAPSVLKDAVVWFVNCTIVNPSFDTQTKETLTTPVSKFGSEPVLTPKFYDQLIKIGLLAEAQALLDAKLAKDAKKTDGKKKVSLKGIDKLEDALKAGTSKSSECTLILTEGDSAATTAISGLKVVGREFYGVFPLKGKILNVKDVNAKKKTENAELTSIKSILGLKAGEVYTDVKQLRYGRVMIMTDQDVDGSHIKGLLMNLFHTDWPSLLRLGFLCCLMTPLLKATKGSTTLSFYSDAEYEAWKATPAAAGAWKTKYYKGLGTSTAAEARDYFSSMNTVEYVWDDAADATIDLAFNKKRADDRKTWLSTYDKTRQLPVTAGHSKIGFSRFVHDELIHFSNDDNIRSLPHVMDGLKPSQRKIFWSALKRNLTSEIRVAQLAGYVSETAAYHHGEVSLTGAIVGMAQNYVGSNNLNLLAPNGQFGTRLMGGKDAASARYIHTQLMPIVKALFKKDDNAILTYTEDDGLPVEPETYLPVLPLLLVNGALGIGTGFSTSVLPYNPADVVAALRARLVGSTGSLVDRVLTPWWFGFRGVVAGGDDHHSWTTRGIYEFVDHEAHTIRIKELPVCKWTKDYKVFLDQMMVDQEEAKKKETSAKEAKDSKDPKGGKEKPITWLRHYEEAYNDVDVDFLLYLDPDAYHTARAYPSQFEKQFGLTNSFKTTNMVAFNVKGHIYRYASTGEILEEFYGERLSAYGKRKAHELARLLAELVELRAKLLFVKAVVDKRLVIANVEDDALLAALRGLGLPALSSVGEGEGLLAGPSLGLKGYEYLLRMRVDRLKAAAVAELERDVAETQRRHDALVAMTPESLWSTDLDEFEAAWADYTEWRLATYKTAGPVALQGKKKAVGATGAVKKPKTTKA
jgi:DNA topoisomerase-2